MLSFSSVLGIREQRITSLMVAIFIGLSTLMGPVLSWIPMPVIYAVFLIMGLYSLKEVQLIERISLMFITKRRPQQEYAFLKYVQVRRVHMFTIIQILTLVVVWTLKFIPVTSIGFPLLLLATCGLRKLLDYIFTPWELNILDDLLPGQKNVKFEVGEKEKRNTIHMKEGYINESFQMDEVEDQKVCI